jgi:hypothetical protein
MHATFGMMTLAAVTLGMTVRAQEVRAAQSVPRRAPAIVARLRSEAAKITSAPLSPLFSAIADPKNREQLLLSAEQNDLARQLDALTRDIIKAWLLRDLDADPPPTTAALAERVSAAGDRLRAHLIAESDAIVYEGILKPEQAQLLRKVTGQKPLPLRPGRNGPPELEAADESRSSAELAEHLRYLPSTLPDLAGSVSLALLGKPGVREAYPHGIAHLDPIRQRLALRDLPKVELAEEQIKLMRRLNQSVLAICKAWLVRDLDKTPLPPRSVLAQRLLYGGERVRESLFSRAELIALQGIVRPEQAEKALSTVWQQYGMRALLDPTLATRLRLTRSQREQILFLLEAKKEITQELSESVSPIWRFQVTNPEVHRQVDQMTQDSDRRQEEVDELILTQVLTAAQARNLTRILNPTKLPVRVHSGKAKKSGKPG